jgi:hypothetical protein
MIEIATVFLGLITGPCRVDLTVREPVAAVELELDGAVVGRLDGPPWRLTVDLGEALVPHRLTAVGRDRSGAEIGRAERRINLAEGVTVPGREGDVTDAGITAVAVTLEAGRRLPALAEIGSWFLVGDEPAEVLAVEQGPAEVIFVRDPRSREILDDLLSAWLSQGLGVTEVPAEVFSALSAGREEFLEVAGEALPRVDPVARRQRLGALWESWRSLGLRARDASFRLLSPYAAPVSHVATRKEVFNTVAQPVSVGEGFLYQAVSVRPRNAYLRISDAAAIAGTEAFSGRTRRAVVVVLANSASDASRFRPAQVREYLRSLQVPVFVWSFDPAGQRGSEGSEAGEDPLADWGAVRAVVDRRGATVDENLARLADAFDELEQSLEAQRIVWLRGAQLPSQVRLAARASGIRLAGGAAREAGGTNREVAGEAFR